jgi:SAM-dependent methyltransferase
MNAVSRSPSLAAAMRDWWRERAARTGLWRTAVDFAAELRDFLLDSTPERRRQRYGDMDFDWEYRVDTTSATVSWRDRLLGVFHSAYQPTEPAVFREIINGLGIDYSRFTFIDLGSGKGRTLLMASEYPFRRVAGVELLPELNRVAEENLRKFPSDRRQCQDVETICADARDYVFPAEPLVVYLFHPLPEAGLEQVMQNLASSLRESPRDVIVIYHNPLLEPVLARCAALRKTDGTTQYSVYASEATTRAAAVSK